MSISERQLFDIKLERKVRELTKELVDLTNTMGCEKVVARGMLAGIQGNHRTLQQSFFKALTMALSEYADTPYFDARNESSVEFAKKVKELDHHFPFI